MKLLREVSNRLGDLIQFNQEHSGHWTPSEFEEYKRLRIAWSDSVNELSYFENPGSRPVR
jgi:hypothetical protein